MSEAAPGTEWRLRAQAQLVDLVILAVIYQLAHIVARALVPSWAYEVGDGKWADITDVTSAGVGHVVLAAVVLLVYEVGFAIAGSDTPGRRVAGLHVVHAESGVPAGVMVVLIRSVVLCWPLAALPATEGSGPAVLSIGWTLVYLPAWRRTDRRGLHDLIAGTTVAGAQR